MYIVLALLMEHHYISFVFIYFHREQYIPTVEISAELTQFKKVSTNKSVSFITNLRISTTIVKFIYNHNLNTISITSARPLMVNFMLSYI